VLLRYEDRNSMDHSVESRVPLVEWFSMACVAGWMRIFRVQW
jgi:hypothetical protein